MNEVQRQQYLEALGIDSYMPRWILPMAPLPVACAPVAKQTPVTEVSAAPAASRVTPATVAVVRQPSSTIALPEPAAALGAQRLEALAVFAEPVPTPVKPTVTESVAGVAGIVAAAGKLSNAAAIVDPRFALSMWRVSEDLLVIDSRQAQLALPTEPLLANILQALGLPRQPLQRAEVLHWPMYDHALAPKGETAARETLMAMLEAKLELESGLEKQPVSYLLLMGAEACHFVVPEELLPHADESDPAASLLALTGKSVRIESLNATAIVVPSLCDMLQQPALKASTWRAIQPLRQE